MRPPALGLGVGLRAPYYRYVLEHRPRVDWFEVITENFLGMKTGTGGRPVSVLEEVRKNYPIAFHGVSLSVGSADPLDRAYLSRLKSLVNRFEPAWISDHLCWTGIDGENTHDLLPLPYTEEALEHVVTKVEKVQEFLERRILLENVSSYVTFRASAMAEWVFLAEVARRADCLLLLDINNIYVSSRNHGFSSQAYLNGIPADRVAEFHLAGHTDNETHLIDTHDHPVSEPVWDLYSDAVARFGRVSALLERDANLPAFEELLAELEIARSAQERGLGKRERRYCTSEDTPEMVSR